MLEVSEEKFEEMYWDSDRYEVMVKEYVVDTSRWANLMECVILDTHEGKYWRLNWRSPATEYQEEDWNCFAKEVRPIEKTIIDYVDV